MKANFLFSSKTRAHSKTDAYPNTIRPSSELTFAKNLPFHKKNGTVLYTPQYSCFPKTVEELVGILRLAQNKRKKISVVTQGYASTKMAPVADILVYLTELQKMNIERRSRKPVLTVDMGTTIHAVERVLASSGYELAIKSNFEKIASRDKLTTSLHEWILNNKTAYNLVSWVEKVDINGRVQRFENRSQIMQELSQRNFKAGISFRMGLKIK